MKQYLIYHGGEYEEVDNWDELIVELKTLCFKWCLSDYEGPCWESLFEMCLGEKDFGSIATVYEMVGSPACKDNITLSLIM